MTERLTAAQMRAIEQAAIASGEVTGLELMERAGHGVVEAAFEEWPELAQAPHRAVVLCGPGNNGGDGLVVARLLAERGWDAKVFLYGDPERLPPDARANWARLPDAVSRLRLSMPRPTADETEAFADAASHRRDVTLAPDSDEAPKPFLLVDALFGIGLSRPLSGIDDLVGHWNGLTRFRDLHGARVVAIDIPSGLDADTGEIVRGHGVAGTGVLPADLTVTFHAPKAGHVTAADPSLLGHVVVKDIGL